MLSFKSFRYYWIRWNTPDSEAVHAKGRKFRLSFGWGAEFPPPFTAWLFLHCNPCNRALSYLIRALAHYQHGQRSSCRKPCTLWSSHRRLYYSGCTHCISCHSATVPWCNCFGKFPDSPVSPAVCIYPFFLNMELPELIVEFHIATRRDKDIV